MKSSNHFILTTPFISIFRQHLGLNSLTTHVAKCAAMLLMVLTLGVGEMWGTWYYSGGKNSWGADVMTASADGYYEYCRGDYNGQHQFKIRPSDANWDGALGWEYVTAGFNGTDLLAFSDAGGNIKLEFNSNDPYYILIYPSGTDMNKSGRAIICASTTLPDNSGNATAYFIKPEAWSGTINAYEWIENGGTDARNSAWPGVAASATGDTYDGLPIYSYTTSPKYMNVIFSETGNSWQTGSGLVLYGASTDNSGKMIRQTGLDWEWIDYVKDHVIKSGSTVVWDLGNEPADRWPSTYMYRIHYNAGAEFDTYTKLDNNQRYKTYDADTYCAKFLFINNNTPTWTDYRYTTDIEGDPCDVDGITLFTYPNTVTAPKLDWQVTKNAKKATEDVKLYFDNTATNWSNIYLKCGTQWFTRATSAATQVTGTANLYYITLPDVYYEKYFLSNAEGSTGYNDITTMTSITHRTDYQPYHIEADSTLIATTGAGSSPKVWSVTKMAGHTRTVTITAPTNGTITVTYTDESGTSQTKTSGSFEVAQTCILTVSATAATGYSCSALTIGGEAHSSGNTYTVRDDVTIAATFTANTYTVTLDENDRLINPTQSSVTMTYNSSTMVGFSEPSKLGYSFGGYWTSETSNNGSGTMVIDSEGVLQENVDGYTGAGGVWIRTTATTLYAKWVSIFYRVTFRHNGHGTIAVDGDNVANGGTAMVYHIIDQDLVATPNTGYHFTGWTVSGEDAAKVTIGNTSSASTTIKSSGGSATVTAGFAPNQHDITYSTPTGGSFTIKAGDASAVSTDISDVDYGTTITLSATAANSCYAFSSWTVTGATSGDAITVTNNQFTMPDEDVTVVASFAQVNLALNKTVVAGYEDDSADEAASKVTDGNEGTAWVTWSWRPTSEEWFYVDLGAYYQLSDIEVVWGADRSTDYILQARQNAPANAAEQADDNCWITLAEVTDAAANSTKRTSVSGLARYVRLHSLAPEDQICIRVKEFRVYGTGTTTTYTTPTLSTAEVNSYPAGYRTVKLHLVATDSKSTAIHTYRITDESSNVSVVTTDASDYVIINGLTWNERHTLTVEAMDPGALVSASQDIPVLIWDPTVNLALGKDVVAGYEPGNAGEHSNKITDGTNDAWTTYENQPTSDEWFYIDLGAYYDIDSVQAVWGDVYSTDYIIQARYAAPADSDEEADDTMWYTMAEETGAAASQTKKTDINHPARYIRVHSLTRSSTFLRLHEFRVFGSGFATADETAPVINTAAFNGLSADWATVKIDITYTEAGSSATNIYWTVVDKDATVHVATYSAGVLSVTDMPTGKSQSVTIYAMDEAANISAGKVVSIGDYVNPDDNLALNKTTYSCVSINVGEGKDMANDGNLSTDWTSWSSLDHTNDWWYVDLGDFYDIRLIEVVWTTDKHSTDYSIQYRQNAPAGNSGATASQWDAISEFTSKSGDQEIEIEDTQARYICMRSASGNDANQVRIKEFRVFGKGYATPDNTAPVWTDANCSVVSAVENTLVLSLEATDNKDGDIRTFAINVNNGEYDANYERTTTALSNQVTITDADIIKLCQSMTVTVTCTDHVGNTSTEKEFVSVVSIHSTSVNLAQGKTTYAGYTEGDASTRANAVDGNTGTKWSSNGSTAGVNQWFTIDLGEPYDIGEIKVLFGGSGTGNNADVTPGDFILQTSLDNANWSDVHHYEAQPTIDEWVDKTISGAWPAKYVRLWVNTQSTYGTHILEFQVFSKSPCYEHEGLVIYHKGDKADDAHKLGYEPEGFAGGTVIGTIEYRMKVRAKDQWYSLYLPFDVDAVKVWDAEDGAYYYIYPYYRSGGKYIAWHYIIRAPETETNLSLTNFGNWNDPTSVDFLPQKNTPYIIQWHDNYFEGRYISFFGHSDTAIPTSMTAGDAPTADNVVNVCGNDAMTSGTVRDAYLLEGDYGSGAWLREEIGTDRTILPFECYLLAKSTTAARFAVMRRGMLINDTPTSVDDVVSNHTVQQTIAVYTLSGCLVQTYSNMSVEQVGQALAERYSEGLFLLRGDKECVKLLMGGK